MTVGDPRRARPAVRRAFIVTAQRTGGTGSPRGGTASDGPTRRAVSFGLLASGLALVGGPVRAAPPRRHLFDFAVAGGHYHGLYDAIDRLGRGMRLDLVREPENPYDSNAVAVVLDGLRLGYVPRAANPLVAERLDRGERVFAEIAGFVDFVTGDAIPETFRFTSFMSGDPAIRLTVEDPAMEP